MTIDIGIVVEAGGWPDEALLAALAGRAVEAALDELGIGGACELSLLFTDDAHIRRLNATWRGKDKATNVLSFPAATPGLGHELPAMLGDVVLAFETVRREAEAEGKPFENHVAHLLVHGLLHLLGYDHEVPAEADRMEDVERRVLARLAISDPYS